MPVKKSFLISILSLKKPGQVTTEFERADFKNLPLRSKRPPSKGTGETRQMNSQGGIDSTLPQAIEVIGGRTW